MEITDELIKKKHKEFNNRIKAVLTELQATQPGVGQGLSPTIQQLMQTVKMTKPSLPMGKA